ANLLTVQRHELPSCRFVVNMTASCNQEFVVGIEFHRLFMRIAMTVLKPTNHPLVDGCPSFERSAVRAWPNKKAQLVRCAVEVIPMSVFLIDDPRPGWREI